MISVWNGVGSIAWEQVGQYGNDAGVGQVVLMPDSGLLQAGVFDGCDYIGPESQVRRYAPDGTLLWERTITPLFTYPVTMVAKGPIDHIALASSDSVYILDMDGNIVGGFEVPSGYLQRILWASDSTLFMVIGTDLKLADLEGTVLATTTIGPYARDMHWDGQLLLVLADDSIRSFSPDLVPQGSHELSDLDLNSCFVESDSGLYVNTATGLYQLSGDGTPTLLFAWPALPNLATIGCAVRNGTVLAVGNTDISGRNTGIIRTLSMDGDAAQHDQDVEVLLQVDSAWSEFTGTVYYTWNRKADITGYVVNHGADTLRRVVQSMWITEPYSFCGHASNRVDTAGLALAPGDTITLPFGVVYVAWGLTEEQVADTTGEICIVALAPDRLADRAPGDNTACASVDFTVGVNGPGMDAPFSLFPNPASSTCTISGLKALGGKAQIRILDLTGRTVSQRHVDTTADNLDMDISGLPSGTYIFSAEGASTAAMMKLVVTRP